MVTQEESATVSEGEGKGFGWYVVLLKRHSTLVSRLGHKCKHVRAPASGPTISEEVSGPHAIAHTLYLGQNLLTISLSKGGGGE